MRVTVDGWRLAPSVGDGAIHSGAKQTIKTKASPQVVWNGNPYCEPGTVLYLPGHPGSGATINDFSGVVPPNNGTITQALWKRLPSGLWYLDYDGVDDKTDNGDTASLDITTTITVLAWIKPASEWVHAFAAGFILDKTKYSMWMVDTDYTFYFGIVDGGVAKNASYTFATPNVWQLVGGTYDGANVRAYINGVSGLPLAYVGDIDTSAGISLEWGGIRLSRAFKGGMALGRVLKGVALSAAQILDIYKEERHLFGV